MSHWSGPTRGVRLVMRRTCANALRSVPHHVLHFRTRAAPNLLVLTTPNLWFPIVTHDTRLPFCHWLPIPLRHRYAPIFKRMSCEKNNLFWSPKAHDRQLIEFKRVSRFLHYKSMDRFLETFPCYLPYGRGGNTYLAGIGKAKYLHYKIASWLDSRSHYVMPNLAGVYQRIDRGCE